MSKARERLQDFAKNLAEKSNILPFLVKTTSWVNTILLLSSILLLFLGIALGFVSGYHSCSIVKSGFVKTFLTKPNREVSEEISNKREVEPSTQVYILSSQALIELLDKKNHSLKEKDDFLGKILRQVDNTLISMTIITASLLLIQEIIIKRETEISNIMKKIDGPILTMVIIALSINFLTCVFDESITISYGISIALVIVCLSAYIGVDKYYDKI